MIITGILTGCLFLAVAINRKEVLYWETEQRLIDNANSGICLLQSISTRYQQQMLLLDLYDEKRDSVQLSSYQWGLYRVIKSNAFSGRQSYLKVALSAEKLEAMFPVLWLPEQREALSLCGNTLIKGRTFLPKSGVKPAYINQKNYYRKDLIEGDIKESSKNMPIGLMDLFKFDPMNLLKDHASILPEKETANWLLKHDTLIKSFDDTVCFIEKPGSLLLSGCHIEGQIIIYTSKEILVSNSFSCKDIILLSPVIKIEQGFSGSLQAFATDTLITGYDVFLGYPSVLAIIRKDKHNGNSVLTLGEGNRVEGLIVSMQQYQTDKSNALLSIGKECNITGQVISNGIVQHYGNVDGTMICREFLLANSSAIYKNHLLDAGINRSSLSFRFGGFNYLNNKPGQSIVKWLY
jgi:hypothetical protein